MTDNKRANMALWEGFGVTNSAYTKQVTFDGVTLTAIQPMYMFKQATEAFGPWGAGWGVEIGEVTIHDGAPLVFRDNGAPAKFMQDKNGAVMTEKMHEMRIQLWYMLDGKKCFVEGVGTTKMVYMTQYGFKSDAEAPKKSYTDAVKNALSKIGVCNDIYLGMFDDEGYVEAAKIETQAKEKADTGAAMDLLYGDFSTRYENDRNTLKTAGSGAEINKLFKAFFRDAETIQATFKARGYPKLSEKVGEMMKGITSACEARRKELDANASRKSESEVAGAEGAKEAPEGEAQPAPKKKASRSTKSKAEGAE